MENSTEGTDGLEPLPSLKTLPSKGANMRRTLKATIAAALLAATLTGCDGNLIITREGQGFEASAGDTVVMLGINEADCDHYGGQWVKVTGIGRACIDIDF